MATLLLLLAQETVHLTRNDDRRPAYEALLRRYADAQGRLADDPRAALAILDSLLAEVRDGPVECRLRIERMANVFGEPVDFLPYQLRARARLALAALDPSRRRDLLQAALADLDASIARKAGSSAPWLENALVALGEDLRPDLAFERWDPAQPLFDLARRAKPPASWAPAEARRAEALLDALGGAPEAKHATARRALAWSEALTALVGPLEAGESLRRKAEGLLARRTRFTLQIAVSPFAEIARLSRDGKDVDPSARHSPASLALEAGAIEIELRHPAWGKRSFHIAAGDVEDGRTYLLAGEMESGPLYLRTLAR